MKIATKSGYENVALSLEIFAADGRVESGVAAIQHKFLEGRDMLNNWRDVTRFMLPDQQDLLYKLPDSMKLKLTQLAKHEWLMTDICNTAQKFRNLLHEVIEAETNENIMTEDESYIYEADCWNHLRNVWIGGVFIKLGQHLAEVLSNDLGAIPFMLHVTTDVTNPGRSTEKYFRLQEKYVNVSLYVLH